MKIGGMDPIPEVANWPNPLPSSQCDEEDFFSIPSAQHKRGQVFSGFPMRLKMATFKKVPAASMVRRTRMESRKPKIFGRFSARALATILVHKPGSQLGSVGYTNNC